MLQIALAAPDCKSPLQETGKYREEPPPQLLPGDVSCVCVLDKMIFLAYCFVANIVQKQLLAYKSYTLQLSYLKNATILVNLQNCSTINTIQF